VSIQGVEVLNFWVSGPPKTKGSLDVVNSGRAGGRPVLQDSPASKRWRKLVAYCAEQEMRGVTQAWPLDGPVAVDLEFVLSGDPVAVRSGDLDKLYRNVLDALTDAGVYEDDVQVVRLSGSKVGDGDPGVRVRVVI
jgi:Holliday junction resolvase RusA-like endonuclease